MAERHILAVDDDPTMREFVADYLTNHGFRVTTASGGVDMARILAKDSSTWSSWI
jgi:two-component system, OmpR family, response regulator